MNAPRWTLQADQRLAELWAIGTTASEISRLLGVSGDPIPPRPARQVVKPAAQQPRRLDAPAPAVAAPVRAMPIAEARTCQWLEGESRERRWCGEPALSGRSYCPAHAARCYLPRGVAA